MSKLFTLTQLSVAIGIAAAFGAAAVLLFQAGYDQSIFTR